MTNTVTYVCLVPSCRAEMVRRVNRKTGETFLGCSRYPDCAETRPIPERERMLSLGVPELPGFETEG